MINKSRAKQTFSQDRQRIQRAGKLHWFHWMIVGASLLLTLSASYFTQEQVQEKAYNQFVYEAEQVLALISERMQKYEDALWGGVAAIHSQSHGIDNDEWKRFADALKIEEKYPGINGIGVIAHIHPDNLDSFVEEERKNRPNFKIHPPHTEKDLLPIIYIEPIEINKAAEGLDIAHEINRYTAALQARDTGKAQITGPITLVQDKQKTPGFLFYAPYYNRGNHTTLEERRTNFKGMVYAPFIFKKLMDGTLEKNRRRVGIKITDNDAVLYDENQNKNDDFDANPLFHNDKTIDMYGRQWTINIQSKNSFRIATASSKPWMILIGGLLIDSLLLGLFIILARSNKQAIKLANQMSKSSQNSLKFRKLIQDNIPDLLFVKDKDFRIVQANDTFLGLYPEEMRDNVIGTTTLEKYEQDEVEIFLRHDRKAFKEGYSETEETVTFPNGTVRTLLTKKVRFEDENKEPFILGISRDITDIKNAEMRQDKLIDQLMESNTELERFAYIASHDLQEPLRMVTNYTERLKVKYAEQLDEKAVQYLEYAHDGAFRMQNLINDLLEYSKITNNDEGYKLVDYNIVMNTVLANMEETIRSTNAKIKYDTLPCLMNHSVQVVRLLQNLISNAIKYRDENTTPEIHLKAEEKDTEWLFSIKDNGIGFKQEYAAQIFETFKRLHGKYEYPGTGIGLAICKKIVEKRGGEIWADSEINKGSTFFFTIPKITEEEV